MYEKIHCFLLFDSKIIKITLCENSWEYKIKYPRLKIDVTNKIAPINAEIILLKFKSITLALKKYYLTKSWDCET